ncbi:FMN2 [Acanthosepion pharaonis]|uniref:FMN2 n=1 Tax=Acanthosepion pharaonis TaxID=158019 RepID=A0A812B1D6_ACAPH|nr:FMN2 [Sepia pharaonis]
MPNLSVVRLRCGYTLSDAEFIRCPPLLRCHPLSAPILRCRLYPLSALLRCPLSVLDPRCPPSSDADPLCPPPMPNLSIVRPPPLPNLSVVRPPPMPNLSVVRPPPMPNLYVVRRIYTLSAPICSEFIRCPPLLRCRIYPLSALLRCRIYRCPPSSSDTEFIHCPPSSDAEFIRCPPPPMPNLLSVVPALLRCRIYTMSALLRAARCPLSFDAGCPMPVRCPPSSDAEFYTLSASSDAEFIHCPLLRCRVSVLPIRPPPPMSNSPSSDAAEFICCPPSDAINLYVVRPPSMLNLYVVHPPSDAEFIRWSALLRYRPFMLSASFDVESIRCPPSDDEFIHCCPPPPMPNLPLSALLRCRNYPLSTFLRMPPNLSIVRPPLIPNLYVVRLHLCRIYVVRPPDAQFIHCPPLLRC